MTPWDSTRALKAANDAAEKHQTPSCPPHKLVTVNHREQIKWCVVCGAIQGASGEFIYPKKEKQR